MATVGMESTKVQSRTWWNVSMKLNQKARTIFQCGQVLSVGQWMSWRCNFSISSREATVEWWFFSSTCLPEHSHNLSDNLLCLVCSRNGAANKLPTTRRCQQLVTTLLVDLWSVLGLGENIRDLKTRLGQHKRRGLANRPAVSVSGAVKLSMASYCFIVAWAHTKWHHSLLLLVQGKRSVS